MIHLPVVTTAAAGLLGLIFVALSVRVVTARASGRVMLGSGENSTSGETNPLLVAVRSHANFAEYVPLCLILVGGLEMRHGPTLMVKMLASVLVLARVSHPVGMGLKSPNPFRAIGFVGTVLVLAVASAAVIVSAFA